MEIKPIKTEADYRFMLARLEKLFDAPIGTKESDKVDIIASLHFTV